MPGKAAAEGLARYHQVPEQVWAAMAGNLCPQIKLQPLVALEEGGVGGDDGQREGWVLF